MTIQHSIKLNNDLLHFIIVQTDRVNDYDRGGFNANESNWCEFILPLLKQRAFITAVKKSSYESEQNIFCFGKGAFM